MSAHLATRSLACLHLRDPIEKVAAVEALHKDGCRGKIRLPPVDAPVETVDLPGRPDLPVLVAPHAVRRRSVGTREGHAALIHALAHIEFNAINLALDAVYRFRTLPADYYQDWIQVAVEEARHFTLLRQHLQTLGHDYGSFEAHDGLWQMCAKTAHDPLVRMALVPRLLEARGLDANPAISKKLEKIGDTRGVEILEIILRDEIGHVLIGNRWYAYLCMQRGLDPASEFLKLLKDYGASPPRPPLHTAARRAAGFSDAELACLGTE